ncbi:MAG TPA: DUF4190 domain-containing protein [Verrucomicrobiae bacterium]
MYRILGADQKEYGPVNAEQIRQWILERRLGPQSLIMVEGTVGWKPLSLFPEFSQTLAGAGLNVSAQPTPGVVYGTAPASPQNQLALWSLIVACLSWVCLCVTPFGGILSIIFGFLALAELKKSPHQTGKNLALAGIIIGAANLVGVGAMAVLGFISEIIDKVKGQ